MTRSFVIAFTVLSCMALAVSAKTKERTFEPHVIAHGGGAIDGITYTNSLEAVDHALANGVQYIELDLNFTIDGMLVASHNWDGSEDIERTEYAPTYEQFMNHRVYGLFTPLDYHRIDSLMAAHPEMHLVTDKISHYAVISFYFGKYKDRMVIECFSDADYLKLKEDGYEVFRSRFPPSKAQYKSRYYRGNRRIDTFAFLRRLCTWKYRNYAGYAFAVFSVTDMKAYDKLVRKEPRIKYVYVNNIVR